MTAIPKVAPQVLLYGIRRYYPYLLEKARARGLYDDLVQEANYLSLTGMSFQAASRQLNRTLYSWVKGYRVEYHENNHVDRRVSRWENDMATALYMLYHAIGKTEFIRQFLPAGWKKARLTSYTNRAFAHVKTETGNRNWEFHEARKIAKRVLRQGGYIRFSKSSPSVYVCSDTECIRISDHTNEGLPEAGMTVTTEIIFPKQAGSAIKIIRNES